MRPPQLAGVLLIVLAIVACERARPCLEGARCPGTRCWCDDEGRLVTWEIHQPGASTRVWQRYAQGYDAQNRVSSVRWDNDGDGSFDLRTEYLYNDRNEAISASLDWGLDGTLDQECVYRVPCPEPPRCGPRDCRELLR